MSSLAKRGEGTPPVEGPRDWERITLTEPRRIIAEGANLLRNGEGLPFDVEEIVGLAKPRRAIE